MSRESPSDWCHGTLEGMGADFESFQLVQQFDALLEFNKHRIKYSALVLAANQALFPGYRVIGKPSQVTRGIEATICGADFFGRVRLPKSCLNDSNRALKKAGIYSLLQITPKPGAKLTESHAICPL